MKTEEEVRQKLEDLLNAREHGIEFNDSRAVQHIQDRMILLEWVLEVSPEHSVVV